ncbi:hypothetical protein CERSUDRAFT_109924 [Gelatoporia subvermispora B]|uniref:Uncharacterized protein n=1 Tax=Ceriporiopsis subvermispora (strain B) TaxID=914234 RepID=M2PWW2_CERS8|nr:hypothetical protein CERSUDRAFT_109924 [Gelatoporia subvermispora B]
MRRLLSRRRTTNQTGWENLATEVEPEVPKTNELYVVVMGPSDVDKAKFIDEATGSTNRVEDSRHTCPISEAYTIPGGSSPTTYRLIHFPAFSFRSRSPVDTLFAIGEACKAMGPDKVGGLIYLVNIKDVRAKNDRYCNFLFAREICASTSWVIATTGWDDEIGGSDEVDADDVLREIAYGQPGEDAYFEEMSPGSQSLKHDGGKEAAVAISRHVWNSPSSLRMQQELREKSIFRTSAARRLQSIVGKRITQLVQSIGEIRERSQEAARRGDLEKLKRLASKEAAEIKKLDIPLAEIQKLKMADDDILSLLRPLPEPLPRSATGGESVTVEMLGWYAERLIGEMWSARERAQKAQELLMEADRAQQESVHVLLEEMDKLGAGDDELQSLRAALPSPLRLSLYTPVSHDEQNDTSQNGHLVPKGKENELVAELTRLRQQGLRHQEDYARMTLQEARYKARIAQLEEELEKASEDLNRTAGIREAQVADTEGTSQGAAD